MYAMGKNERPAEVESCSKSHERNVCPLEHRDEIMLPQGTLSMEGTDVGLQAEDLDHALQFLEFCNSFQRYNIELFTILFYRIFVPNNVFSVFNIAMYQGRFMYYFTFMFSYLR